MSEKIIIVTFAGRERYLEIQKNYIFKLLKSHDCEWHLWNFSRNESDNIYLQNLANSSDSIKIFNQFYDGGNASSNKCEKREGVICGCSKCRVGRWTEPYKFYANNEAYKKCFFLKMDDDILFIDIKNIDGLLKVARTSKNIISSYVINNGLIAMIDPLLNKRIDKNLLHTVEKARSPLARAIRNTFFYKVLSGRDVQAINWWRLCTSVDFFRISHDFFFEKFDYLVNLPENKIRLPKSRFSINAILFNWEIMSQICSKIGNESSMNDEAIISENFEIDVYTGFVSSHLHFADQRSLISDEEELVLLKKYSEMAKKYLIS